MATAYADLLQQARAAEALQAACASVPMPLSSWWESGCCITAASRFTGCWFLPRFSMTGCVHACIRLDERCQQITCLDPEFSWGVSANSTLMQLSSLCLLWVARMDHRHCIGQLVHCFPQPLVQCMHAGCDLPKEMFCILCPPKLLRLMAVHCSFCTTGQI